MLIFSFALLILSYLHVANSSAVDGCKLLSTQFPDLTITNHTTGSQNHFTTENDLYYSASCILHPKCIFVPRTAQQVGTAIKIIDVTSSNFAIRSGGHSTSVGFANTDGGIVIALDNFNGVVVSSDRKSVSVGPGQSWQKVFDALTPQNLTVLGGRLGPVGVGGLLVGGMGSLHSKTLRQS